MNLINAVVAKVAQDSFDDHNVHMTESQVNDYKKTLIQDVQTRKISEHDLSDYLRGF
jgi:hypothetical protein